MKSILEIEGVKKLNRQQLFSLKAGTDMGPHQCYSWYSIITDRDYYCCMGECEQDDGTWV